MQQLDARRAEAFNEKMVGVLNGAALALMTSVGHRTGLFDVMSAMPPASVERIAGEAGLSERYVREWLGAMVTAGVVEYDPGQRTFALPAEHAAFLCREARPNNLAASTQWIALLGGVEDQIVECFERGGGVPYSAFGRFHAVMAEESDQTVVAVLEDAILPIVPDLPAALERGIDVLDVGCGSGRAVNLMARRYPHSRFTGFDMLPEGIGAAKAEALSHGLRNVRFEVRDVSEVELSARFDLITAFDAIHDQARPEAVLAAVAKALRPDGVFLMQDIAGTSHLEHDAKHPLAPFLYTISCMHCMTVSLSQGGRGLGAMWGRETASRMLEAAGFARPDVFSLPHDPINQYYVARRR
ncbi:MAG TPA: class I SAM-dependent methyltransferase [Myxococcota bacterium]|nr:class I SAM-dependent methyltransferase [Myxococcota bacterium]